MYKPSLGLGTKLGAAANKSDLSSYLKNLKKKQKELNKKHPDSGQSPSITTEEDDSDLASIARELYQDEEDSDNIFNSPFIKKPASARVRHTSDNTTPLPEKEFSFISSTKHEVEPEHSPEKAKKETKKASKALDQFVKFDQKYTNFRALKKIESTEVSDESEPILSPVKMTPSPKGSSRLRRQAEQAGLAMLSIPKKAPESTTSDVSEHFTSPRSPKSPISPIFSLENLHDIEELVMEDVTNAKDITPDVQDNYFTFTSPSKKVKPLPAPIDEDDEVLVTEDDVDEELIEIELSEEIQEHHSESQKDISQDKEQPKTTLPTEQAHSPPITEFNEPDMKITEHYNDRPQEKSKKSREKKHKKRRRRVKSCYYCDHVCDFHMGKLKPSMGWDEVKQKNVKHESVQAGMPNVKYGKGHYMFDPSQDAMTGGQHNYDYLAFIRSAWTGSDVTFESASREAQKVLSSHQNPMAYALSELLKGQLELTSSFLSNQKSLYATYCASLSSLVQEPIPVADNQVKVLYPRKYQEASSIKEQSPANIMEESNEEYESEFESASSDSESDHTIVPTEISAHE